MRVVHRDLKPGNVLISYNSRGELVVKLLDFGIAKIKGGGLKTRRDLTAPGAVLGTQGYMAPEQVLGDEVDERADLYSVGVLTLEALMGRRPFEGRNPMELTGSISDIPIELPSEAPEAMALGKILERCLRRDPAERYASVRELQEVLIPVLRTCPPLDIGEDRRDGFSGQPTEVVGTPPEVPRGRPGDSDMPDKTEAI
jgi:serine/threonine-protein kinase